MPNSDESVITFPVVGGIFGVARLATKLNEPHCQLNGIEVSFPAPLGGEGVNPVGVPRTSPHRATTPPTEEAYHRCLS